MKFVLVWRKELRGKQAYWIMQYLVLPSIMQTVNISIASLKIVWKSLTRTLSIWLEICSCWPTSRHYKNTEVVSFVVKDKSLKPDDYFGENLWRTVPMKENRWRSLSIMDLHLTKRGSFQSTASSVHSAASTSRPQSEVPLTNNGQSYELIKSTQVS